MPGRCVQQQVLALLLAGVACLVASCDTKPIVSRVCQGSVCIDPDGTKVYPDGTRIPCELGGDCVDGTTGGSGTTTGSTTAGSTTAGGTGTGTTTRGATDPNNVTPPPEKIKGPPPGAPANCNCPVAMLAGTDNDGDCIPNSVEVAGKISDPNRWDSDADRIGDGCEDVNHNGQIDPWVDTNNNGCFDAGEPAGESNPRLLDSDGDLLVDGLEDSNHDGVYDVGETLAWLPDTDCDGLVESKEDVNRDGATQSDETDPRLTDTDGDGLADGLEDTNHNGRFESATETSPLLYDTDADSIPDGLEDRNHNGAVDAFADTNHNGCWDAGEAAGESDPRKNDTDGDGIPDALEDTNRDGLCTVANLPFPLDPNVTLRSFVETCAFAVDTDCDGLGDGLEDRNKSGTVDQSETNPRKADTDFDGLADGCTAGTTACEDKNNNGVVDPGETNPTLPDTDGDNLSDGCELSFAAHPPTVGGTNPLSEDTDGDGTPDGDEDRNHNCQLDNGETDPRVANAPPVAGSTTYPQWSVCASENLNGLTFAQNAKHDFRLAFEIEKATTGDCPGNTDSQCSAGQRCVDGKCLLEARYLLNAFGRDTNHNGFSETDLEDELWGFAFESPPGLTVDQVTDSVLNRDVYGFLQVSADNRALDDILDAMRAAMQTRYPSAVTEIGNLPSRPAFDSLPNNAQPFRVSFAQRQFRVAYGPSTALALRNDILERVQLAGQTIDNPPPTKDPVYGDIACQTAGSPQCYDAFVVYIGAVQRLNQLDPISGQPRVLITVALTPDTSTPDMPSDPNNRFVADRVTRLEDLTGGSALARYAASVSKACDARPQTMAEADMLWVVDDSRSMQQMITRLQHAATDAQAVLTSNSGIVDFRLAMTTTNPSKGARAQCPDTCDQTCGPSSGVPTSPSACDNNCADQVLSCIKQCPAVCNNKVCTGGLCTCDSCGTTNGCPTPLSGFTCADAASIGAVIAQDANTFALPGGGGTFYYENTAYLDCDSSNNNFGNSQNGQAQYLNQCKNPNYNNSTASTARFANFYGPSFAERALIAHAGLLHSDPTASCTSQPLDLRFSTNKNLPGNGTPCADPTQCCTRLTDTCTDGPQVLASQMCDLIRAMGGLPGLSGGTTKALSSSARRHSSPEHGTRSARRLLQSLLPALPLDYSGALDAKTHLRLNCRTSDGANCPANGCDPTQAQPAGASGNFCPNNLDSECDALERCVNQQCRRRCAPIPMATVILSDEEDFWFKDECQASQVAADQRSLPQLCRYVDGDPNTVEACTETYCQGIGPSTGHPTGYDPDQAAWNSDGFFSGKWRDPNALECAATGNPNTCVGDPCPGLSSDQCGCAAGDSCPVGTGSTQAYDYCYWKNGACQSACVGYTEAPINTQVQADAQKADCVADPRCQWDQSLVRFSSQSNACVLKWPATDCQPCKRFLRNQETIQGKPSLMGFGPAGPVYAIVRNKGAPGQGGFSLAATAQNEDACKGGDLSWGRGDGQAYRDAAIATLGRTQDVCAASYRNFMQLVTADLAVLSRPYPLSGAPIAATLKIGIARPAGGTTTYIAVPRSRTQGFIYDATNNSIGFKSDPIDGECGSGSGGCAADGIIEPSEVSYARTATTVPQVGDTIYISYRVWLPVPCLGSCTADQTCARSVCVTPNSGLSCNAATPCLPGYTCTAGTCTCSPGQVVDQCIASPECGACQAFDTTTRTCQTVSDQCVCNASGKQSCNPNGANACSIGWACDETCVCSQVPGCGTVFNRDDTVSSCFAALTCCNAFSQQADDCAAPGNQSQGTCPASGPSATCKWVAAPSPGHCAYKYSTCCPSGAQAKCFADPETGTNAIYCAAASCTCNCSPPTEECDVAAGCACYHNGG